MAPADKAADPALASVRAAIELAEQAASLGDHAELEAKVASNPADHQVRFDLALALAAQGDRDAATDHLVEIIKRGQNLERRRCAQAAPAVLRGLGTDGRHDGRRAAQTFRSAIPLKMLDLQACLAYRMVKGPRAMSLNASYRGPDRIARSVLPVFPLPGALLLPRGECRSIFLSPAMLRWSTMRLRGTRDDRHDSAGVGETAGGMISCRSSMRLAAPAASPNSQRPRWPLPCDADGHLAFPGHRRTARALRRIGSAGLILLHFCRISRPARARIRWTGTA